MTARARVSAAGEHDSEGGQGDTGEEEGGGGARREGGVQERELAEEEEPAQRGAARVARDGHAAREGEHGEAQLEAQPDARLIQRRCSGDAGEMQGRCRGDAW